MLASLLLAAGTAAAVFAPQDGRTYRLTSTLTRSDGATTLHFAAERTIVFRREANGWSATMTLRSVTSDAPAAMRARFDASVRRTEGTPLVAHLDATGALLRIDDEEARWAAYQQTLLELSQAKPGAGPAKAELTRLVASSLNRMTPEARRAVLAASLLQVIGSREATVAPAREQRITIPSTRADGRPLDIPGRQRISRDAAGLFVHAEADDEEALAGGTNHVHLAFDRRIDPVAGLVLERRESRDTRVGSGANAHRDHQETVEQLVPVS